MAHNLNIKPNGKAAFASKKNYLANLNYIETMTLAMELGGLNFS
jgi:hypothetical protein